MTDVQPIFAKNRSTLISRLRLTGASSPDAISAVDGAMVAVAIGLFDRLGEATVATIQGYTYSDDASAGANSRLRLKAAITEEKWIRHELMRKMPVLFMDSASKASRQWNEEEFSRNGEADQREISRLWNEVLTLLDDLEGNTSNATVSAMAFGPDTSPVFVPGGSVLNPLLGGTSG